MSFVRSRSPFVALFAAVSLAGMVVATPADAAQQPAPKLSGLKARVAQGVRVDLAASSLAAADLTKLRPEFARLKPRARTNAE